jgi:hypothetical protein
MYVYFSYLDFELLGKMLAKYGEDPGKIVAAVKAGGKFTGRYGEMNFTPAGEDNLVTVMENWPEK